MCVNHYADTSLRLLKNRQHPAALQVVTARVFHHAVPASSQGILASTDAAGLLCITTARIRFVLISLRDQLTHDLTACGQVNFLPSSGVRTRHTTAIATNAPGKTLLSPHGFANTLNCYYVVSASLHFMYKIVDSCLSLGDSCLFPDRSC